MNLRMLKQQKVVTSSLHVGCGLSHEIVVLAGDQTEWKGKPFPFSKGCSFYRCEIFDGKRQIV